MPVVGDAVTGSASGNAEVFIYENNDTPAGDTGDL